MYRYGIEEEWYTYRDEALKQMAVEAAARASKLRENLVGRKVHPDILKFWVVLHK